VNKFKLIVVIFLPWGAPAGPTSIMQVKNFPDRAAEVYETLGG
jgi:hypothetical protein